MPVFVYAAKFLCGSFDPKRAGEQEHLEGPVKPGNYVTAINVHNPNPRTIAFEKKGILLFAGSEPEPQREFERPIEPGPPLRGELPADWGMEIDCPDIRMRLLRGASPPAPVFIKGWVIMSAPAPLDVVAVYTSHTFDREAQPEGFSLEIERVPATQLARLPSARPARTARTAKRRSPSRR